MTKFREHQEWEIIPPMEGFFFEMNQALSSAIISIGLGDYRRAIKYMKRFRALVKPSGIFNNIMPQDKVYGDKFIEIAIFRECDNIIKNLEDAGKGSKLNLRDTLISLSNLIFRMSMYYMYAKTKVSYSGSYPPAFEIFEKEGIE